MNILFALILKQKREFNLRTLEAVGFLPVSALAFDSHHVKIGGTLIV